MKIYFAGSIRGGRNDAELYGRIIAFLKKYGQVLTEHIGEITLTAMGDDGPTDRFIHDRDLEWLLSSDLMVAEVTQTSLGVGYEIGRAVENHIPVICMYRPRENQRLSAMISGNSEIKIFYYQSIHEAESTLKELLESL